MACAYADAKDAQCATAEYKLGVAGARTLRALHIPYISKCFYVNFFKRNHLWIQSVLRARRRQRLASETAAERERRLSQRRARDRARRAARSSPTSETRLVQMGSVERLYLQHGENYLNLSAFDDVLRDISCSSDVTPSTLLKAKPFTLSYVNNIIVSVEM